MRCDEFPKRYSAVAVNTATLHGAMLALRAAEEVAWVRVRGRLDCYEHANLEMLEGIPKPISRIILKTDSERLVRGVTEGTIDWEDVGSIDLDGNMSTHQRMFKQLDEIIVRLECRGIAVQFWLVNTRKLKIAYDLASDELQKRTNAAGTAMRSLTAMDEALLGT